MEQRDLSGAFVGKTCGNIQGLLVPIGQIHWHQNFSKHWAYPLCIVIRDGLSLGS